MARLSWEAVSQKTIYWICFRKVPHLTRSNALRSIENTYADQEADRAPDRPLEPYLCQLGPFFDLPAHWHVGHAPEPPALVRLVSALRWIRSGGKLSPKYRYELSLMQQKCDHMVDGCFV